MTTDASPLITITGLGSLLSERAGTHRGAPARDNRRSEKEVMSIMGEGEAEDRFAQRVRI